MINKVYTLKQLCKLTGLTDSRIRQLRNPRLKHNRRLIPKTDYFFNYDQHRIEYTETALSKLLQTK